MKRFKRQTRLGIIAAASFLMLVTVLPQIASGFGLGALANRLETSSSGCSGSSGSSVGSLNTVGSSSTGGSSPVGSSTGGSSSTIGSMSSVGSSSSGASGSGSSSGCTPVSGTLTGKITVTGAPKGFSPPYEGVGLCPAADLTVQMCTNPSPTSTLADNGVYTISLPPGVWRISGFYEVNPLGGAFLGTGVDVTVISGQTVTKNVTVPYKAPATLKGTVSVTHSPSGIAIQEL